ncbi:flagellar hook-length control protein FliK [Tepidibacillus sp. LV47]|uniref:flagellar hook-length control protein FliK n=1 Tax=Tepidibacillus sp. LV47 TaxID=3398228 RepID=UPI003AAC0117
MNGLSIIMSYSSNSSSPHLILKNGNEDNGHIFSLLLEEMMTATENQHQVVQVPILPLSLNENVKLPQLTEQNLDLSMVSHPVYETSQKGKQNDQINIMYDLLPLQLLLPILLPTKQFVNTNHHLNEPNKEIKNLVPMTKDGIYKLNIQLVPKELGQLDLKMIVHQGQISAQFIVDTEAAKELIEGQIHQLRQSLIQQGIQADQVEVHFAKPQVETNLAKQHVLTFKSINEQHLNEEGQLQFVSFDKENRDTSYLLKNRQLLETNLSKTNLNPSPSFPSFLNNDLKLNLILSRNQPITISYNQDFPSELGKVIIKHSPFPSGISEVKIQLHPKELGQIDVKIINHQGQISAQFNVDTAVAKELIEGQIHQLRQSLIQQGIQVDRMEVQYTPSSSISNLFLDMRSGFHFSGQNQSSKQYYRSKQGDTSHYRHSEDKEDFYGVPYQISGIDITV